MSYILRAGLYFLRVCAALGGASRPAQAQNSLWTTATIPANTDENDPNSVELGVKFKSSVSGTVSAIQFYKGPSNVGPHTVTLWNSYGTKLASTKSTNETASGWQTVTLEASINITEGEIYVASYHTPGFYAGDHNYFVAPYSNGPLTAPINAGVYNYGTSSGFPSSTWNHSNYWVDIAFMPSSGGTIANGACGSSNGASLTSAPTTNLCNAGTASAVTEGRPWGWSCAGSNGGTAAQCSAAPASLNGQCGPADGVATGAAPISGLCAAGQGSSVTGSGPWNWSCMGSNGGAAAQCSAPLAGSGDKAALLSSDRDASANWKMAGMLSVGGIPIHTTV